MIIKQSATLLVARGLSYLSVLVVLPSFITITNPNEYADIVLLATLIGLAPLLDGGQATASSRRLARDQNSTVDQQSQQRALVIKALRDSALWSLSISAGLVVTWATLSKSQPLTIQIALICIASTALATLSNTSSRLLLVEGFSKKTAATLILGPLTTAGCLAYLRYLSSSDFLLIASTFCFGASLPTAYYIYARLWLERRRFPKSRPWTDEAAEKNSKTLRYSLFLSQIIGIAVTAKNPLMIRMWCDDATLGQYSILWAAHSLLVAPTASMQAPLLTNYSKMHSQKQYSLSDYTKHVTKHIIAGIAFAGLITILALVARELTGSIFSENMGVLSSTNISIIYLCACIYISSIILGTALTATGNTKAINKIAITVLITDAILVSILVRTLGGMTPIVTMAISNIIGISIVKMSTTTPSGRHE